MTPERLKHYIINIDILDKHHSDVFNLIDVLILADDTIINYDNDITSLAKLIEEHFIIEEQMMRDIGFPYLDYHIVSHNVIISHAKSIKEKQKSMLKYSLNDLTEKLIDHIDNFDFQVSLYFDSNRSK